MKDNDGKLVAAKMIVYAGESDQYTAFISPEAYNYYFEWLDFRASYGEKLTEDSWAMRDAWKTTNITYGAKLGYAKDPIKLQIKTIPLTKQVKQQIF